MSGSDQTKTTSKTKGFSLFGKGKKKKRTPTTANRPAAASAITERNASNVASITAPARPSTPAPVRSVAPRVAIGARRAAPQVDAALAADRHAPKPGGSSADALPSDSGEASPYSAVPDLGAASASESGEASPYSAVPPSPYSAVPPLGAERYATAARTPYAVSGTNLYSTAPPLGYGVFTAPPLDFLSMSEDESSESSESEEDELPDLGPTASRHDPFNLGQGHLLTTPLLDKYRGEDRGLSEPGHLPTNILGLATPTTGYAAGPEVHRTAVADGKLVRPGGAAADSSAAERMWMKDKDERLNFVMDGHGSTYLSDPKAEFMANKAQAEAAGQSSTSRVNHSTMIAGGDVAGAGTVRARDGKVEALGDGSGHYQPAVTQTAQVARTLAAQGVMDPARSTIELSGKGGGEKDILLSSQELLSYGEGKDDQLGAAAARFQRTGDKTALAAPEAQIRARHAAKDAMQQELLATVARTRAHDKPAAEPVREVAPAVAAVGYSQFHLSPGTGAAPAVAPPVPPLYSQFDPGARAASEPAPPRPLYSEFDPGARAASAPATAPPLPPGYSEFDPGARAATAPAPRPPVYSEFDPGARAASEPAVAPPLPPGYTQFDPGAPAASAPVIAPPLPPGYSEFVPELAKRRA